MRYALRRDGNTKSIEQAFRDLGCVVHATNGAWDLTVQYAGITMLVEVKDGSKSKSKRKLTPAQEQLHARLCIRIVKDIDGVLSAFDTLKKWQRFIQNGFTGVLNEKA